MVGYKIFFIFIMLLEVWSPIVFFIYFLYKPTKEVLLSFIWFTIVLWSTFGMIAFFIKKPSVRMSFYKLSFYVPYAIIIIIINLLLCHFNYNKICQILPPYKQMVILIHLTHLFNLICNKMLIIRLIQDIQWFKFHLIVVY